MCKRKRENERTHYHRTNEAVELTMKFLFSFHFFFFFQKPKTDLHFDEHFTHSARLSVLQYTHIGPVHYSSASMCSCVYSERYEERNKKYIIIIKIETKARHGKYEKRKMKTIFVSRKNLNANSSSNRILRINTITNTNRLTFWEEI